MAAFLEIIFPQSISYGVSGGPTFATDIVSFVNGREQRNIKRNSGISHWDAAYGVKDETQMRTIVAFFRQTRGRAHGFRFHDWTDYKLTDENIGTGNGSNTVFNISKVYGSTNSETRRIYKLAGTQHNSSEFTYTAPVIKKAGVTQTLTTHYTLDYNLGIVTFVTAPAGAEAITITAQFHVPARFDTDILKAALSEYNNYDWGQIPIRELINVVDVV